MVKYLNTEADTAIVQALLKRYLSINKHNIITPYKLKRYLSDNYNLDINYIIDELINMVRATRIKNTLVQIKILNKKIGDVTLEGLVQLIEFGNRDIEPTGIISRLLNRSLSQVEDYLGGI